MKMYGEAMYRFAFSWPRHQLEMSGQLHFPAALSRGKSPQYPLDMKLGGGGGTELVGMVWRSENPWSNQDLNPDPLVIQPADSRYANCANVTNFIAIEKLLNNYDNHSPRYKS
jgi:hypothetical protein